MTDKNTTAQLKEILKAIQTNAEVNNRIMQLVSDVSSKLDYIKSTDSISILNPGKKAKGSSTSSTENIMTWFKKQYAANESLFESIVPADERDKLYKDNITDIKKKKTDEAKAQHQASLVYKHIIKPSTEKMGFIRAVREDIDKKNTSYMEVDTKKKKTTPATKKAIPSAKLAKNSKSLKASEDETEEYEEEYEEVDGDDIELSEEDIIED